MRDFIDLSADATRPAFIDPSAVTLIELSQTGRQMLIHHQQGGVTRLQNDDVPFDADTIGRRLSGTGSDFVACGDRGFVCLRDVYFMAQGPMRGNCCQTAYLGLRGRGLHAVDMTVEDAAQLLSRLQRLHSLQQIALREIDGLPLAAGTQLHAYLAALRMVRPVEGGAELSFGRDCSIRVTPATGQPRLAEAFAASQDMAAATEAMSAKFAPYCYHLWGVTGAEGTVMFRREDLRLMQPCLDDDGRPQLALHVGDGGAEAQVLRLTFSSDAARDAAVQKLARVPDVQPDTRLQHSQR